MLQQISMAVVVLLGFVFGYCLPHLAPEEMKPGKKYFKAMEQLLAACIFAAVYLIAPLTIFIAVSAIFLAAVMLGFPRRAVPVYIIVIFFILTKIPENALIIASLGLLYGLPAGTLVRMRYT
ncbi:MAG TPA: hypothetical protein VJH88_01050 [Candidatus Nanoarchaeia archaeon]|nr:hypothetical protein [Candidatus Nanoarchaeia archaeon]